MPNLLIEIGTEELPTDSLDILYASLNIKAAEILKKLRLTHGKIRTEATPRRIVLFVETLAARQPDQTLEISGPSFEKAYDDKGSPTQALQGFLKSKGAKPEDVQIKETPKGKFIQIFRKETGKPAQAVAKDFFSELFNHMSFPKNMRWEPTGFRFPRPVRWLVVLLDKKIVPVQIADVKSSNKSFGHRFLSPRQFTILSADWGLYVKLLAKAHVMLALEERKKQIRKHLGGRFQQKDFDEDLVHTAAHLVEEPFLIRGSFSKTYLELPAEVLHSCMKKNQKIFTCYDRQHKPDGHFVAVLNGRRKGLSEIQRGYENVLAARLHDARYFYEMDTREKLESKLDLLSQIVFLGKLGTMKDKAERVEKLADQFARFIGREDIRADLKRVARLSKIDLMTHLVYEFPDLQGVAGREYALASGEKETVAVAIGTQYFPKSLNDDALQLRKTIAPLGGMFGIIDRMDLLVGAFGMGLEPSGSQDPYALRRAGGSIVKIIRAFGFHFSLSETIDAAANLYGSKLDHPKEALKQKLVSFFKERLVFELKLKPGSRPAEILDSVMRASFDDMADVFLRFDILNGFFEKDPDRFLKAAKVVERTSKILKGLEGGLEIDTALLSTDQEKRLYALLKEHTAEIQEFLKRGDFERATVRYGEIFYNPIHDFFSQVMVNVEDVKIRKNRQALMKSINRLYSERLADLSVLSRIDQE